MLASLGNTFISLLAPIAATVLAAFGGYVLHHFANWLKGKTKIEAVQHLIDQVTDLAGTVALSTEQTVVDSLKKSGQWGTPASYQQAMDAALAQFESMGAPLVKELAANGITDITAYLTSLIEAKVKEAELAAKG